MSCEHGNPGLGCLACIKKNFTNESGCGLPVGRTKEGPFVSHEQYSAKVIESIVSAPDKPDEVGAIESLVNEEAGRWPRLEWRDVAINAATRAYAAGRLAGVRELATAMSCDDPECAHSRCWEPWHAAETTAVVTRK